MKNNFLIVMMIVVVGTIGLQTIPYTYALSCGIPLFSESFEKHDLLLHGKLVEKNILPVWENQKLTSLTFDTIHVYKGEISKTFTVKANLSWDDYYVKGEEYVLFADKDENGYYRDDCVPNYLASPSIIKFLDEFSAGNALTSDVRSLNDVVRGFERDELDLKLNQYANQNRNEVQNPGYVVETSEYAITWFGALQIFTIVVIVGVLAFFINRRIKR